LSAPTQSGASRVIRNIVAALILVPLTIVIVAFAVANRQRVIISLDPFGSGQDAAFTTRPLPLFLVLFGVLILGVVIGGTAGWLRHGGYKRTAKRLDQEVVRLRAELDAHKRATGAAPPIAPAAPPERLRLQVPVA
jgi:uncharacterized integral membrane protein